MKKLLCALCHEWHSCALGGLSFWLPDVIYHYVLKAELNGLVIFELTFLMPFVTAICYVAVFRARKHAESRQGAALFMLVGIWLFGPVMIMLGTTFADAGFKAGPISIVTVIVGTLVFPLYTAIMSGLDLTISALILVTLLLSAIHFIWERNSEGQIHRTTV